MMNDSTPACNGGPSAQSETHEISENVRMMDPATIRFTNTRFPPAFSHHSLLKKSGLNPPSASHGVPYSMGLKAIQPQLQLSSLLAKLQAGDIRVDSIPSIRVFFYNDCWYSLDNRRLWVFKQYGAPIPVTVTTSLSDFLERFQPDGDNQTSTFLTDDIRNLSIRDCNEDEKQQDLIDLVSKWTIDDIMDDGSLNSEMNAIPETFNSLSEYFNAFKWPLVEELRAQLKQTLEEMDKAPYVPVLEISETKHKQFIELKLCLDLKNMSSKDRLQSMFGPKDLVLLSPNCGGSPGSYHRQWSLLASIMRISGEEDQAHSAVYVKITKAIDDATYQELMNVKNTWYLVYLSRLATARRTWKALHCRDSTGKNYSIIRKTLQYNPTRDLLEGDTLLEEEVLKEDIANYCSFLRLNDSQADAVATILCDVKAGRNPGVRMIQGPPGTGKTSTIVALLSVATGSHMKCLTVCPTNTAIATVALRYMEMLQSDGRKQFGEFCKPGVAYEYKVLQKRDVILVGLEDKLPVEGPLNDIYLPRRVERIQMAARGWKEAALTISALINCKIAREQVEEGTEHVECETVSELPQTEPEDIVKILEEHSNTLAEELPAQQAEVFLLAAKLAAEFLKSVGELRADEENASVKWPDRGQALSNLKNELERGLTACSQRLHLSAVIEQMCLKSSCLVFCTVSTGGGYYVEQAAPFKCLLIDEAAQLVEAETAIVTSLPGLNHAILVGDHHQLPATVISKSATKNAYGRSLFERMMSLGHPCHLLNVQYRMHPAISLFPSVQFYQSRLLDGDNVTSDAHKVLEQLLYGPYAFLDVSDGSERTGDDKKSKANLVEVSVILALVRTLRQACLEDKINSLTLGIITPYSCQKDHIKQGLLRMKTEPLIVDVNSVDGFQGQEKDIIILSTVRANKHGDIGFLKDYRRLNVAITRARYCLWIVGCSRTLTANQNIWKPLLQDAINRRLFKRIGDDHKLAKAVMKAKKDLMEDSDLSAFSNMLWKLLFSNNFKNALLKIKSSDKRHRILQKIGRLASGHHASPYKKATEELKDLVEVHMVADLCLIWSIDVERDSQVQQVIKVWDMIELSELSIYVKRLQNAFDVYSEGYIARCKTRETWENTTRPVTWEENPDFVWLKPHGKCAQHQCSDKPGLITERSTVSESLLLMKFYAMSSGIAQNLMIAADGAEIDLPFQVNEEESKILKYPSSCFILGRSGTGKTTVIVTKLIQREQQCRISQHGFKFSEVPQGVLQKSNNIDQRHIKQILVTLSPLLCAAIKKQISQIRRTLSTEGDPPMARDSHYDLILDAIDEDRILGHLPDSFIDIPEADYPMILTFRKFLTMLGSSLSCTSPEGCEKITVKRSEVDYQQFDSDYWPHMDNKLTKKLDSCIVYTEIASVIKGSIQAMKTAQGYLSKEMYLSSARKGQQLSLDQKETIYMIFLHYEKLKMQNHGYDMADNVKDVYSRLATGEYRGDKIDFVYIDEVQDFTPAQISLFSFLCSNPNEGYIFAGDTAQTIARGVNFRFQEARSLFYTDFGSINACSNAESTSRKTTKEFMPAFFQLSHNFRTHVGVVNMANSIVQLLYHFFPQSIDKLDPETSLVWGQLPVLLKADGQDLAKQICNKSKDTSNQGHGFGAQQVILVRDDAQKTDLVNKIGKHGLVLTVSGSKGLEFEDVLMYNFFTGSPLQNSWRVIYDYVYEKNLMAADNPTKKSYPAFDVQKHSLLCSELKHIYVAVTRARQRLWIYEEDDHFCQPIVDYWVCQELLETKPLDESFISQIAAHSTRDEWRKRGFEVLNHQHYDMAILCFERAGDQHHAELAKAASLQQFGEKQININRDVAIASFRKASEMYLTLERPEIAAKCCIKSGDYHKAGLIYTKNCKPQRFEDGGDWFLEAKSWQEAEDAYFEGKCIEKCLNACLLAKHYERGHTFILQWTKEAFTLTEKQCTKVEHMNVYLKKCAEAFHHKKEIISMMMFVEAFSDIELKRAFLREKNFLAELLNIEEAAKNYLQAAELAELTGNFLRMAELLEQAKEYNNAVKGLLFLIRKNVFWGDQRRGWPLQPVTKPKDLLQKVQKLAGLAEESVRYEAELEVLLLFEEFHHLEDILAHRAPSCSLKIKLFTAWKGIDTVLKIFGNDRHKRDKNPDFVASFQARNALLLKFVNMWKEWENIIQDCKEAVLGDAQDNDTREFCYEFFAVKPDKEAHTCIVHCHEAYWFRGYRRGRGPIKISVQEFSKLTARFWDEQVKVTCQKIITAISNQIISQYKSLQRFDIFEKINLLIHLAEVANKLATSLPSSQDIQEWTNTLLREIEVHLWPPPRQEKQMFAVQKLRNSMQVVKILDMIATKCINIKRRSHTMEETARLQLIFPFLSDEWKLCNLKSLVEKIDFWKDVNMWPSNASANADLPVYDYVLDFGKQLLLIFNLDWRQVKNYISPLTFVTLMEKATVMACACHTLLHGTLLPLTWVLDFMCEEGQKGICRQILSSRGVTHQNLVELIGHFANIATRLITQQVEVSNWFAHVGALYEAEYPLIVQRLFTLLLVISVNSRQLNLVVNIINILNQTLISNKPALLRHLPGVYKTEIGKVYHVFCQRKVGINEGMMGLKQAFAKALSSMGDTLIMTKRCEKAPCCRPQNGTKTIAMDVSSSILDQLAAIPSFDLLNKRFEAFAASVKTCDAPPAQVETKHQNKMEAAEEGPLAQEDIYNAYLNREACKLKVHVDELVHEVKNAMVEEGNENQLLHELDNAKEELQQQSCFLNPSHEKHLEKNLEWLRKKLDQVQESHEALQKIFRRVLVSRPREPGDVDDKNKTEGGGNPEEGSAADKQIDSSGDDNATEEQTEEREAVVKSNPQNQGSSKNRRKKAKKNQRRRKN